MKKFINPEEDIPSQIAEAVVTAWSDRLKKLPHSNVVVRKNLDENKIGVLIGNGSGHEPACICFVGENMLDANAYGGIFAAPDPITLLEAIKACDTGQGVVLLVSNHAGDVLNAKMACELAECEDIKVHPVILYDDISSAPKEEIAERRGTIGTFFNYKMAGSYSEEAHSMDDLVRFIEKVRDNTRSLTVASVAGTSPLDGEKMFQLKDDEVEIGIGVHGESAASTVKLTSAKDIAYLMTKRLIKDKPYQKGDEVLVIVNGCGQTTMMELLIFYKEVDNCLKEYGIKGIYPAIGSFITTQEMGGIALSFCKADEEIKKQWLKPTNAPAFPHISSLKEE